MLKSTSDDFCLFICKRGNLLKPSAKNCIIQKGAWSVQTQPGAWPYVVCMSLPLMSG